MALLNKWRRYTDWSVFSLSFSLAPCFRASIKIPEYTERLLTHARTHSTPGCWIAPSFVLLALSSSPTSVLHYWHRDYLINKYTTSSLLARSALLLIAAYIFLSHRLFLSWAPSSTISYLSVPIACVWERFQFYTLRSLTLSFSRVLRLQLPTVSERDRAPF